MFVWEDYSPSSFVTMHAARIRHADVVRILEELRKLRPDGMKLKEIGKSYEGRPIFSVTVGTGPIRIFAWSQMHGDEPTHTAVLLDLIDLLQRHPGRQICKDILNECTLTLVPMLNPDGAERYIRRTAQDIDMNRDALHLATPEGRLLRQLVEQIKPEFAFNLHNQRAGTSVDGFKPAAVSLLVPPIDLPDTQTEWTQKARQVAAVMRESMQPHCEGMISRYDADFMPRCFGEWVQQQEIATLTIEAGGWSTVDTGPLVQLHFLGMINALECIANGCYVNAEAANYDSLPRSSDQSVFDVMVRSAQVVPGGDHQPFEADFGINFKYQDRSVPIERRGVIDDFGDLCLTGGKQEFVDKDLLSLPGRIVCDSSITPKSLPSGSQAEQWLTKGITTVVGIVDVTKEADLDALTKLSRDFDWPVNVGFLAKLAATSDHDRVLRAIAGGVLGFMVDDDVPNLPAAVEMFKVPVWKSADLPHAEDTYFSVDDLVNKNREIAKKLGLRSRSTVKLGTAADLLFLNDGGRANILDSLKRVMLGGRVVVENGKFISGASGELLLR